MTKTGTASLGTANSWSGASLDRNDSSRAFLRSNSSLWLEFPSRMLSFAPAASGGVSLTAAHSGKHPLANTFHARRAPSSTGDQSTVLLVIIPPLLQARL